VNTLQIKVTVTLTRLRGASEDGNNTAVNCAGPLCHLFTFLGWFAYMGAGWSLFPDELVLITLNRWN
jgi:hypothetical protein